MRTQVAVGKYDFSSLFFIQVFLPVNVLLQARKSSKPQYPALAMRKHIHFSLLIYLPLIIYLDYFCLCNHLFRKQMPQI